MVKINLGQKLEDPSFRVVKSWKAFKATQKTSCIVAISLKVISWLGTANPSTGRVKILVTRMTYSIIRAEEDILVSLERRSLFQEEKICL